MGYFIATTCSYLQMPHAWIAVLVPAALVAAALWINRGLWTSFCPVMAVLAGTVLTWLTARWMETPDHLGLHLQPAAFLLLLIVWRQRVAKAADLRRAVSWASCMASLTWSSLLLVDVGACVEHPVCQVTSVGGAGALDMLVLGPVIAFIGVLLIWFASQSHFKTIQIKEA